MIPRLTDNRTGSPPGSKDFALPMFLSGRRATGGLIKQDAKTHNLTTQDRQMVMGFWPADAHIKFFMCVLDTSFHGQTQLLSMSSECHLTVINYQKIGRSLMISYYCIFFLTSMLFASETFPIKPFTVH